MELTGSTSIRQPIEVVWSALNNEEILRQCITGCESLERIDSTSLIAKLAVKLGPVRAKFNGKIKMSDVAPLQGYTLAFEGSGGAAGFAKGSSKVSLQAVDSGTLVSYTAQASVGGKLGQVGGRMIDATARSMADDFFKAFTGMLESTSQASDVQTESVVALAEESARNAKAVDYAGMNSATSANTPTIPADKDIATASTGEKLSKISWFVAGMIAATLLMLIGKHCL